MLLSRETIPESGFYSRTFLTLKNQSFKLLYRATMKCTEERDKGNANRFLEMETGSDITIFTFSDSEIISVLGLALRHFGFPSISRRGQCWSAVLLFQYGRSIRDCRPSPAKGLMSNERSGALTLFKS